MDEQEPKPQADAQPDPKTAEPTGAQLDRFTWHPDDIRVVVRNGKEIPPTKLSDLVAMERAEAEGARGENAGE